MNTVDQICKCEISLEKDINLLNYEDLSPELLLVQGYNMNTYKVYANEDSLNNINNLYSSNFKTTNNSVKIHNIRKININYYNKIYINQLIKSKHFLLSKFKLHDIYSINNGIILTSPFNIQISRIKGKSQEAYLETTFNEIDYDDYEVLFGQLHLPLLLTNMLPAIYSHEIIHTQLMSQIGSIDNFFNNEVLPIFIELVYQYENNKDNYIDNNFRINHLHISSSCIDKDAPINKGTFGDMLYYVSTITAYKLLNIYIKGNNFVKKGILENIQSVFDNKFTLEDLLNKYDLNWTKKRVIL